MPCPVNAIFVPQGAEFKAVQRGLKRSGAVESMMLYATPMGPQPTGQFLEQWLQKNRTQLGDGPSVLDRPSVLLVGLCGSLTVQLNVGDRVLYQSCIDGRLPPSVPVLPCDEPLLQALQERLSSSVTQVTGLMCDRLVHLATQKAALAQQYPAEVVDMEGYAFLEALQSTDMKVGMLRVVSDDAQHDVPDLAAAMTETGELNPLALASSMIRQPQRALRLIRGSLTGLKQLEGAIVDLCGDRKGS
jgi:Phosphorylase superfamily